MSSSSAKRPRNTNYSTNAKRMKALSAARDIDERDQRSIERELKATQARASNQAKATIQGMLSRGLAGAKNVTERLLKMAKGMGADLTEAVCQYAIRPTSNPKETALVVYKEIPDKHVYHLLTKGTYKYILPRSELNIKEALDRGEKSDPGGLLMRLISNEERLGNELIQLYKALIASLKGLHSCLLAKKCEKEESESIVKLIFANLLMVLVKKHLKDLHNMETRLHFIRMGQEPREGSEGADCSQYTFDDMSIELFDPIINNILNSLIASWPHLAIEFHLNPGVIVKNHGDLKSLDEPLGSEPEILGSFELAESHIRGPVTEYLASQWTRLDIPYASPASPLSPNIATTIAITGVSGPVPVQNTRNIKSLFNREADYEKATYKSVQEIAGSVISKLVDNMRYLRDLVQFHNNDTLPEVIKNATDQIDQSPEQIAHFLIEHRFPERTCIKLQKDESILGAGTGLFGGSRKKLSKKLRKTMKLKNCVRKIY